MVVAPNEPRQRARKEEMKGQQYQLGENPGKRGTERTRTLHCAKVPSVPEIDCGKANKFLEHTVSLSLSPNKWPSCCLSPQEGRRIVPRSHTLMPCPCADSELFVGGEGRKGDRASYVILGGRLRD